MFTGIISDVGLIAAVEQCNAGRRLIVETRYDPDTIDLGASIACAGVCLTVVDRGKDSTGNWFAVEAWEEALRLTSIDQWKPGTRVNLERAMKAGDEYGGHMVSGHIDGIATIASVSNEGEARRFTLDAPAQLAPLIAPKGSLALDGTSLTVNHVEGLRFDVLLIRHSLAVTTWAERKTGDGVNLEVDMLARYVERYVNRLAQFQKEV